MSLRHRSLFDPVGEDLLSISQRPFGKSLFRTPRRWDIDVHKPKLTAEQTKKTCPICVVELAWFSFTAKPA